MNHISFKPLVLSAVFAIVAYVGLALGAGGAAVAQDKVTSEEHNVEISKPNGWEQTSGNEKAVAVFTHNATQSQIEIVPTKLMTKDVSDVFFNTFHKTLTESNFEQVGAPKDETKGGQAGKHTVYKFTHSGVELKVHVFGFTRETTSWLVVGYMQAAEETTIMDAFNKTLESMTFK